MQWHEWTTQDKAWGISATEMVKLCKEGIKQTSNTWTKNNFLAMLCLLRSEAIWNSLGKPYYNVHPKILRTMLSTKLDKIPVSQLEIPGELPAILVRLAGINKCVMEPDGQYIRSILMSQNKHSIEFHIDTGIKRGGICSPHTVALDLKAAISITEAINQAELDTAKAPIEIEKITEIGTLRNIFRKALQIAVVCRFIHDCRDEELIQYDVLNKYKDKFDTADKAEKELIIDKSRRRGKIGWNIGTNEKLYEGEYDSQCRNVYEESGRELTRAHLRCAHLHIVRTGPGRKEVKTKWFRATVVRPDLPFRP
jgi:hypothetical protein